MNLGSKRLPESINDEISLSLMVRARAHLIGSLRGSTTRGYFLLNDLSNFFISKIGRLSY